MKKIGLAIFVLLILVLPYKVNAAVCTIEEFNKAANDAKKLKVTYEIKKTEADNINDTKVYYLLTVQNLTENIMILGEYGTYEYGFNPSNPSTVQMVISYSGPIKDNVISIHASKKNSCYGKIVYSAPMKLEAYNKYYDTEACYQHPEFELCKKDYEGELLQHEFEKKLEEYLNGEEVPDKPVEKPKEDKKTTTTEKILDFIIEYKMIFIPVALLLVIGIVVLIMRKVRKHKKRVKIDLEV